MFKFTSGHPPGDVYSDYHREEDGATDCKFPADPGLKKRDEGLKTSRRVVVEVGNLFLVVSSKT